MILVTGACSTQNDNVRAPGPGSSYAEAHAAAVAAIEYSAERGHAWSTADALLEQAVTAAAEGDNARAIQLADGARIQAELAARQADIEEQIWTERVLSAN